MYVLDTNVISELRKVRKGTADKTMVSWANHIDPSDLFLSTITIMEIEQGILLLKRRDAVQAAILHEWLDQNVLLSFMDRVLVVDVDVARQCAKLHVPIPRAERDALIAATAIVHGMAIVTRNVVDFRWSGLKIINPWQPMPTQGG